MIGLRITCDRDGCEEHYDTALHLEGPAAFPAVAVELDRVGLAVAGDLVLPKGWAVGEPKIGELKVLCAAHAPRSG